jgi:PAS domain S-box-containing protein
MAPRRAIALLPGTDPRLKLARTPTLLLATALFASVFALRLIDGSGSDDETLLYVIPVGVLALGFGLRGGLVGAPIGFALTVWWDVGSRHVTLSPLGYLITALAYLLVGVLVGVFVEARRNLEHELLRYFDDSLDLLWTADLTGRLVRVNRSWSSALGIASEDTVGRSLVGFIHPDDRDAASAEILALVAGQLERIGTHSRFRAADGGYVWMEWRARVCSPAGVIQGVARDVTAQLRAERHLADEAKRLATSVAERTRDLNEARSETLQLLAVAGEYRDDETSQHTERVGVLASRIGESLGLSEESVMLLREAAPLHDIGKLAIPDKVLLKPGRLSGTEQSAMHLHTTLGARLLYGSRSPALQLAGVIAETHHEWWDGSGYPKGVVGVNIPLVGRIVAVADVFDALIHDRPYKPAWPVEQALAKIRSLNGSQFDPRVVEAFLGVVAELDVDDPMLPRDPAPPPQRPVGELNARSDHGNVSTLSPRPRRLLREHASPPRRALGSGL